MTDLHGQSIFEEGDVLFARLPEFPDITVKIQAVKATKDNDYCYDCVFNSRCSKYKGNSPFSWHCYATIFKIEDFIKNKDEKK